MSGAPFLRSPALQRALALSPAGRSIGRSPSASFGDTLAQVQSSARQPLGGTREAVAAAWTAASRAGRPAAVVKTAATASARADAGTEAVPFQDLIVAAADRHGIDPALLAALVKQESNFNPNAKSGVGARGLTQLMDATARGLGVTDSFDPGQSLEGGARFLGGLLRQFHGDPSLALAAYNAGPGAVQKYGGIPPFAETRRYVPAVLGFYDQFKRSGAFS